MSRRSYVIRRAAFSIFALYLVLSVTFGFIALTADPGIASVAHGASRQAASERANMSERQEMVQKAIEEYKAEHDLNKPIWQSYVDWMVDITTLEWGRSYSLHTPVLTVLAEAIPATLKYVVPAMLFALIGGIGLGVYAALNPGTAIERIVTAGSYIGFGIPNYWLAVAAGLFGVTTFATQFVPADVVRYALPTVILGTSLLAGQLRYARAESREHIYREFIKLLRAKGATNWLVAQHILRNAAIPLLSLFFADLIGTLVVNVFVLESVLGIPGIGSLGLRAIQARDLPLILGIAMVIAFAGIVGNLLQDLAYLGLDPRVDSE
ncbi:ABC transporter permease [Haladaptatus sp. CMAA 1911]|uniref:ABC transporter permease n=1 Tax=unclassified Haladaptatus TaxID=2622732 RepID=UPI00375508F8